MYCTVGAQISPMCVFILRCSYRKAQYFRKYFYPGTAVSPAISGNYISAQRAVNRLNYACFYRVLNVA